MNPHRQVAGSFQAAYRKTLQHPAPQWVVLLSGQSRTFHQNLCPSHVHASSAQLRAAQAAADTRAAERGRPRRCLRRRRLPGPGGGLLAGATSPVAEDLHGRHRWKSSRPGRRGPGAVVETILRGGAEDRRWCYKAKQEWKNDGG